MNKKNHMHEEPESLDGEYSGILSGRSEIEIELRLQMSFYVKNKATAQNTETARSCARDSNDLISHEKSRMESKTD